MKTNLLFPFILLLCSACSTIAPPTRAVSSPSFASPPPVTTAAQGTSTSIWTETPVPSVEPVETGACVPLMIPFSFLPDGYHFAGRTANGVAIYNLQTFRPDVILEAPGIVLQAAISPDGQLLAWALDDNTIQLIHLPDQQVVGSLEGHTGMITALKFSADGEKLYSASHDTWVRIWGQDGSLLDSFQPSGADNLPSEVLGIGISLDGKVLASIPFVGGMKTWNLETHQPIAEYAGSIDGGYDGSDAAFSPDGQYLAQHLGAGGGYLSLWKLPENILLFRSENISGGVAFSPDNRWLAFSEMIPEGSDHVSIRSVDGKDLVRVLEVPGETVRLGGLVFSPDSSLLVSVDWMSGRPIAWKAMDGKLVPLPDVDCP